MGNEGGAEETRENEDDTQDGILDEEKLIEEGVQKAREDTERVAEEEAEEDD